MVSTSISYLKTPTMSSSVHSQFSRKSSENSNDLLLKKSSTLFSNISSQLFLKKSNDAFSKESANTSFSEKLNHSFPNDSNNLISILSGTYSLQKNFLNEFCFQDNQITPLPKVW